MNQLVCFAALLAAAAAAPGFRTVGFAVPASSQGKYHAQDELGQYSFGHHEPNQARAETRDFTGITRGSYSYVDANGKVVTNHYVADENGFRSSLAPSNGNAGPLIARLPATALVQPAIKYSVPVAPSVAVVPPTFKVAAPQVVGVPQPSLYAAGVPPGNSLVKTVYEPSVRYVNQKVYAAPYTTYVPEYVPKVVAVY